MKHILPGEPIPRGSLFHERRYQLALAQCPQDLGGVWLLDIGCGNASQTEYFAKHFQQVVGLDLQISRLPGFREELKNRKICNITFCGGDGENLPFRSEIFDGLTCFEVLEHVKDQEKALGEIRRVLKPNGLLLMTVPHRWWIFETHGADLPILPWNRVPLFSWLPKKWHDAWARARNYTSKEIKDLVVRSGFREVTTRLMTAPMDVVKNKQAQRLLRKTLFTGSTTSIPFLASNIFIFVKK